MQEKEREEIAEEANTERVIDGLLKIIKDSSYSFTVPKNINWLEELAILTWNSYGHYKKKEIENSITTIEHISSIQVSRETDFLINISNDNPKSDSYFLAALINIGSAIRNKILFEKTDNNNYEVNFRNHLLKAIQYAEISKNEESIMMIEGYRGLLNEI